jgi:hypothetical protein
MKDSIKIFIKEEKEVQCSVRIAVQGTFKGN